VLSKPITPKSMNVLGHGLALPLNRQSLDLATGPLINFGGASAAYSLRDLNGRNPRIVRVRRASDNHERDFYKDGINSGELTNWVNSQIVPPLDIGVETSEGRIPVPEGGTSIGTPVGAYSLRNLSTTYTGNVVDVRRSIDDAVESFTAAEVADGTLEAWVSAPLSSFIGNKMWFGGDDDYVELGAENLAFGSSDFEIEADIFISSINGTIGNDILTFYDGVNNQRSFIFKIDSSGVLHLLTNATGLGAGNTIALGNTALSVGERYTVKVVKSGSTASFFVDGASDGSGSAVATLFAPTLLTKAAIGIGLNQAGPTFRPFHGIIYDLSVISGGAGVHEYIGNGNTDAAWVDQIGSNDGTVKGSPELFTGQGFDGFVTKWYDQSGNDNHATQGTAASQPKIVDGGSLVSGGNKFDGTNDFLTFPDTFLSGSFAISTVFNLQNRDKTNNTLFGYSNNTGFIRYQVNRLGIKLSGGENFINITLANNRDYVMSITRDASNLVSLYVDGSFIGSFTQSGQFSLDRIGVFAESSSYFLQGTMTETLIYNSDQSANRTAIEANIGETYGITGIPAYDNTVDGFVETWYDQSGNGNDATQSVAASQPKIVDAGVLVSGGLDFDGVDDVLGTSLVPPNAATLIGVANWDIEDQSTMIIGARDSVNQRSYLAQTSSGQSAIGVSSSALPDVDIVAGDDYLLFGVHSGLTRLLSTNGSVISDSGGSAPNNTIHGYSVGALNTVGTNGSFMDGTLAEVIVYNSDQSANRVGIEANINAHYDIY
jgi:hypothetical protein